MTDYASLTEFKQVVPLTSTDATRDTVIGLMLTAASRAIDAYCNRPDGFVALSVATARVYAGNGTGCQRIDDCVEVSLVAVKAGIADTSYVSWTTADWLAFSGDVERPNFNALPYTQLMTSGGGAYGAFTNGLLAGEDGHQHAVPTVQVTAKWGYAVTVPAQIKQATIAQCARWWKRGQSSWADTLANADTGQLMFTKAVDPDIEMILKFGRFVRPTVG